MPEGDLDDLRERLRRTRWPEREPVGDASQGAQLDRVRALCGYWRDGYDWRRCEARLNGLGQHRTQIDSLGIHFLHVRSPEADALPLIMTHGWPGSVIEFDAVVGPLTDPAAHGGDARDAFHLVLPSLPGYGFSDKPIATGWGVERIARAWATLMARLGYGRWAAQGGDWGAVVTLALAAGAPAGLAGVHVNTLTVSQEPGDAEDPSPDAQAARALATRYVAEEFGYAKQQSTRPQTLGYGLADSPAGQLAWIYEKLCAWSDSGGEPETVLSRDAMLDNVMLYWLPNAGASSARLYRESMGQAALSRDILLPVGVSLFPGDITRAPRAWAERRLHDIIHWGEPTRGGHFAAFEQPTLFVAEVRDGLRALRRI